MSSPPVSATDKRRRFPRMGAALAIALTLMLLVGAGVLAAARSAKSSIDDVEQEVPAADEATRPPTTPQATTPETMTDFLTRVLAQVDDYWTDTLAGSGLPEPSLNHQWVAPGQQVVSGCEDIADQDSAFYCPTDDTIYIGQQYAYDLWAGTKAGLPGTGRAYGDFAVAFTVAHEYGHNLQAELGLFEARPDLPTKQFELQADCFAGVWANSAYHEGLLEPGDVEEALATALAIGDFEYQAADHHGRPWERRDAWLAGYNSGSPATCTSYVPV
jgi:predicted metalloprotease